MRSGGRRGVAIAVASLAAVGWSVSPAAAASAGTASGGGAGTNTALAFGSAQAVNGATSTPQGTSLHAPAVAIASSPDGGGYFLADAVGNVVTTGDAVNQGSLNVSLQRPIVGMATDPPTGGYWLVSGDGGVYSFGAPFWGSAGGMAVSAPFVGMAATPDGGGYWLVSANGGVFSFGDAHFAGSAGGMKLAAPIVGMAATSDGGGYWLVAADGGVLTFGDAHFAGSAGGMGVPSPFVGIAPTHDGGGYWLVDAAGGVYTFGDAPFEGAESGASNPETIGIAGRSGGYWLGVGEYPPGSSGSTLRLQQLLATLGYLPLTWTATGQAPGAPGNAEIALTEPPTAGSFAWSWTNPPPTLAAQWSPGVMTALVSGAVMAFEAQNGLNLDGIAGTAVWTKLEQDAASPTTSSNSVGYTYALVSKASPETITVWHNGTVVDTANVNTGISVAPTADGTFPVYERLQNQIMRGTNPNGSSYADPVAWVAYFNGGDAVHYIARGSYGYPQSLGCVETSYSTGQLIWPYLTYGSLVTVS